MLIKKVNGVKFDFTLITLLQVFLLPLMKRKKKKKHT